MKNLLIAALLLSSSAAFAGAPSEPTTVKVWGNCGMCEKTIEKAARVKGVKSADWDTETKQLKVTFDKKGGSIESVERSIAAAGYDTEHFTGDQKAYDNLHGCCQYERK